MNLRLCCISMFCGALAFSSFLPLISAEEAKWKKVKETSDGIVVNMREAPGTNVLAVKATSVVNASPKIVLASACDPKTFVQSLEYVEVNKLFYTENPNVWFNYQMLNFPVIDRRDYTVRYEREENATKKIYRVSWRLTGKKGPQPRKGVVRVKLATGKLDIIPIAGGARSKIHYYLLTDPGGSIPAWIVNLANRVSVPTMLREIRDGALRRK